MMFSSMAGRPYKVGRFAHTLRVRLMQEHVGVDVDTLSALDHDLVHQTESVHQTRDAGADQSAHTSNVMQTKDESGLGRSSGESEATGHAGSSMVCLKAGIHWLIPSTRGYLFWGSSWRHQGQRSLYRNYGCLSSRHPLSAFNSTNESVVYPGCSWKASYEEP